MQKEKWKKYINIFWRKKIKNKDSRPCNMVYG